MAQEEKAGFQSVTFSFHAQTYFLSESVKAHTTALIERKVQENVHKVTEAARTETDRYDRESEKKVEKSLNELNLDIGSEERERLEARYIQDIKEAARSTANAAQIAANQILTPISIGTNALESSESKLQEEAEPDILDNVDKKLEQFRTGQTSSVTEGFSQEIISKLNQHSSLVAEKIEQGLQGLLPPSTTVKCEVSFRSGSLIMMGTIMLLDWVGTMALKATKEALEEQFGNAVKIIVKRVFNQVLDIANLAQFVGPMDNFVVEVRPMGPPEVSASVPDANVQRTPSVDSQENRSPTMVRNLNPQILLWVILILVIAILFNSLFTISVK
jgi:hypothetical protein